MADLDAGKLEDVAKVETAEAFSVGLTCLDAAILEVSNALYGGHQFDCVGLERKFKALESLQYSEPLVLLIESLCSTNVDARSRCSELVEWL